MQPTERGWEDIDPRFSARNKGYENEVNRFGWIVEIDPQNPTPSRSSTRRWDVSSTKGRTSA